MGNADVRQYAKKNRVFFWQCAQAMGISESTMTRRMRTELSEEDKHNMLAIIDELAAQTSQATATN